MAIVMEFETTYYTDWKCAVCKVMRRRDYPARVTTTTGKGDVLQCLEHSEDDEEDECECHCHSYQDCTKCGEPSG